MFAFKKYCSSKHELDQLQDQPRFRSEGEFLEEEGTMKANEREGTGRGQVGCVENRAVGKPWMKKEVKGQKKLKSPR
jgi:hypothetical protein